MAYNDIYSLEAELINTSKRELTNGSTLTPIEKLRLLCLSHGAGGLVILGRSFAKLNIDKKEELSLETFKQAIKKAGYSYEMKDNEIEELFDGFVDINDFFDKLRSKMSVTRVNAVNKAFTKMDPTKNGTTDFETFKKTYIVDKHPKYQNGDYTKASILEKMLSNFENNTIRKEDFLNYYSAISAQIEKDIYFDLLMRECYNL